MAAQNTYQYVDKGGKLATVQAADSATAIKTAGIAANSGVRLVSGAATAPTSTGQSTTPVATPTQTQVQAPLSAGQQATTDAMAQERSIAQSQGQSVPQYTSAPSVSAGAIGNTQPMSLPTTPGNTSSNTAAGAIGAAGGTNQILQELQKQTEDAKLKAEKEQSTYDKLMSKYLGKGEATAQAEADAGVNELKSTAQALTQEYNTKTLSYNAQFQQIMQQPGLSIEQKNNQVAAITRNHAYEMTDLSIRQNISQGNYQAAQEGVDKKIAIEYGDLKDLISFQSGILSDAKNNLSDKEKTKLTLLNQENERKLAEVTYQAHALQEVKTNMLIEASKNGASQGTLAAIQSATSEGAAVAAGGKYIGLMDRQLQQSQLQTQALQRANISSEIAKRQADIKAEAAKNAKPFTPLVAAGIQNKVAQVSNLVSDKYLSTAVGSNTLARTSFSNFATGGKDNFIAGIEQLRSELSLDSLVNAKANGATFGALSEGELKLLSQSASKLSSWAQTNSDGKVTGYKANEKDFKAELDRINNFTRLDYILRGGKPTDVGVITMVDGSYATKNSDGSYTILGK